ncbi:MAG: hypothetical protein LC641_03450 [Spirochaeta sp.]|nr:hypothetical protein [Spirochaeta sp.]
MITFIQQGGIILVIIMALSVAAVAIIVERLLYFRRIRGDETMIIARLKWSASSRVWELLPTFLRCLDYWVQ